MIADASYLESLWNKYVTSPASLPADWRNAFDFIQTFYGDAGSNPAWTGHDAGADLRNRYLQRFGHLHASLDPLGIAQPVPLPHGLLQPDVVDGMRGAYTGTLAVETGHLDSPEMAEWVASAFEEIQAEPARPDLAAYEQLLETEIFDGFLASKYPGKKRFGSEGADVILPLLHAVRRECARTGIDEIVIGSMHRGRLSILGNFGTMSFSRLFGLIGGEHPFADQPDQPADLPYHLGFEGVRDGVHCTLFPNPSHLEAVNPLVIGYTRARRQEGARSLAVILHTDASVIGQGVNAELLQMSGLRGFEVGGTLHVVVNNQVGFTTNVEEARTSRYCTGPWRAVDSLLLHVNGDDVDAGLRAVRLAMGFRRRFASDAVIDLVCYRANGHNEIDEPRFTQPVYYRAADAKTGPAKLYERRMIECGLLTPAQAQDRRQAIRSILEEAYAVQRVGRPNALPDTRMGTGIRSAVAPAADRGLDDLREIITALSRMPQGRGHAKMAKLMSRRLDEIEAGISWPLAEAMAFACVLREGRSIRFCGQDVERGSFSQRHLAAIHPETGAKHHTLLEFARDGARFEVINSPLSEYAVLGFEYGYSLASAQTLCLWEAQFGDFANGAQIVIDQFIAAGFEKWTQTSGLTILLPHGLEGQGPEHSSARIERLLQLCAGDNIAVAHPTTPANYFHLLLDQARQNRRPLFIVTPKMLLRLPQARSELASFTSQATFEPVIVSASGDPATRAILCSGKIAYEVEKLRAATAASVSVLRLEALYPFPAESLSSRLKALGTKDLVWLQEEPENFGAGAWLMPKLAGLAAAAGISLLPMVARSESASPAGSFHNWHDRDQHALILRALGEVR